MPHPGTVIVVPTAQASGLPGPGPLVRTRKAGKERLLRLREELAVWGGVLKPRTRTSPTLLA